jgi:hypothetical protein
MTDDTTDEERAYQQRLADFRRKLSAMAIAVMQKKHPRPLDVAGSYRANQGGAESCQGAWCEARPSWCGGSCTQVQRGALSL